MLDKIISNGFCTGCGVCISEDKSHKSFMHENQNGFLVPNILNTPRENFKDMVKVCPFNNRPAFDVLDEDILAEYFLSRTKNIDPQIGRFENLYVGYSNEFRLTSSSGGIATFIFQELLRNKIVDRLFIVSEKDGGYCYQLFEDANAIATISKTRYIPVTMEMFFEQLDSIEGTIAISGVGCFVKAVRLKQFYNPKLKEKIKFLVGIICGGLKSRFFTDYLSQNAGINGVYSNQDYRIKNEKSTSSDYSYGAFDHNKELHTVRMKSLGDMWGTGLFKSFACDFCDDVTTELADISVGDAWMKPYVEDGLGTSVIVTRSLIADTLIKLGVNSKKLTIEELSLTSFKQSQSGSFNHRHHALQYRVDKVSKMIGFIPYKRKRLFRKSPFLIKMIQNARMKIRMESIDVWKRTGNVFLFNKEMKYYLVYLRIITKINQKIRKIKHEKK